jgi:hypothetical protein
MWRGPVPEPVVLRIRRPYPTEEAYLAAEAWTVGHKSMILLGQAELEPGTLVRFDVSLESGPKLMRAEATVVGPVVPRAGRPGGLRVKYRRFGASTKAFIDRACEAAGGAEEPSSPTAARPPLVSLPELDSEPDAAGEPDVTEPSGIRHRVMGEAPPNRDELLARLRTRARSLAKS